MAISALAVGEALAGIVGAEHVVADPGALAVHAIDEVTPRWMARPGTVEEVSRLLALATVEGLAVAPRGSGSSLALGAPPRRLDLVLDTVRLARMLAHAPEDMVATAEAGMTLGALAAQLAPHRQRLPVDPPGGATRTLGGVLATGASGPLRFRYGGGRDLLLGARFVQADGTITWGGARVVKSVSGYDVPKLLAGSLGTLGVIAEVTLRLHPIPPAAGSWLIPFPSDEAARGFLGALLVSTVEPDRVVVLGGPALVALGRSGAPLALALSVASVPEAVMSQATAIERLAAEHGGAVLTEDEHLWRGLGAALDGPVLLKLAGEPARLVAWLRDLEGRAAAAGLAASAVGEARSGVLWATLAGRVTGRVLRDLLASLREALSPEGGSAVLERAPIALKADCDPWGPIPPGALELMRRLKAEFDPAGVLNPGRFVGGL